MRCGTVLLAANVAMAMLALSGCLEESSDARTRDAPVVAKQAASPARDPASPEFRPHVVVAVIDTGVNVYHSEFAEQYEFSDPATYLPGYPTDVIPLQLSPFKSPAGPNRERADSALWNQTKARTLYRVEDTKIVGLISFAGNLPGSGHGTMTSSRAVGNTISTGGPAIRLVHVLGFNAEGIGWAANQPWIDILSISSGVSTGVLVPGTGHVLDAATMKAFNDAAHKKPFFASSGNGIGNLGLLGFPSWLRGPSGVPDVISTGANDNGRMAVWHNQHSYIVGDGCQNPSATDNTPDRIANSGGGTSSATPFSAGSAAKMLLEARRLLGDAHVGPRYSDKPITSFSPWSSGYDGDAKVILAQGDPGGAGIQGGPLADGILTQEEFKDVLYHSAIAGGSEDKSDGNLCTGPGGAYVPGSQVPPEVRVHFEGYGEVNGKSIEAAVKVLGGQNKIPARALEDTWYRQFHGIKAATFPQ